MTDQDAAHLPHAEGGAAADSPPSQRGIHRLSHYWSGGGLTVHDKLAVVVAAVLPIAYVPQLGGPTTTPRLAVALIALPVGVVMLVRLIRCRDAAAIAAAGLISSSLVSALINPVPMMSLKGSFLAKLTWLILLAGMSLWALGRSLSARGRKMLGSVVVASVSLSVMIGVVQIALSVDSGPLGTFPGRASGLMANAAFYGSAVIGAAGYAAVRAVQSNSTAWYVVSVWMAFGVGISGSRGVVWSMALFALVILVATRSRAWLAATSVFGGLIAAVLFTSLAAGASVVSRTASRGGDGRLDVWRFGLSAFIERPIFGWGFSNHGYAVRPYFTEEFTRAFAWDDQFQSWQDPHNIVMMLLVTTGSMGVGLAGWFVAAHMRRGVDLAYFAAFILTLSSWMLQPTTLHSLPIALLFLGASMQNSFVQREVSQRRSAALIGVGILLAALLTVPNAMMINALRSGEPERAERLLAWLPGDTVFAEEVARGYAAAALADPRETVIAVEKSALAVEIDPNRPRLWALHARRLTVLEAYDEVPAALERAFMLERWNPSAWEAKLAYAITIEDYELADETRTVICRLDLVMCATGSRFPIDLDELENAP